MDSKMVTVTVAKERPTTGTFVFRYDHEKPFYELASDTGGLIDVTKPLAPDMIWALVSNNIGSDDSEGFKRTKPYVDHRYSFWEMMKIRGVSFKPQILDLLGDDGLTPASNEIIYMMEVKARALAESYQLDGSVHVCRAGFAKFCLCYTPEERCIFDKESMWCCHSKTKMTISCLNTDNLFDPKFEIKLDEELQTGAAYQDTTLFKFMTIADQFLKDCYFHLLRLAQIDLSQYEWDVNRLPQNLLDTHTICDHEEAKQYVEFHAIRLKNYLHAQKGLQAAWISVQFHDLSEHPSKVKLLRLLAVKPKHSANKSVEPTYYVDFEPNITGEAPEFAEEVTLLIEGNLNRKPPQKNYMERLARVVAGNAILRDFQSVGMAIPMLAIPKYWELSAKAKNQEV